jgi:hypothetical protein
VLRLKEGEYTALGEIASDVADRLLPLFVVPPPKERDPELDRPLTISELAHVPGRRVGRHWPLRQSLLDPRFLLPKLGREFAEDWLPALFRAAIAAHGVPILVADLCTIEGSAFRGIQKVVRDASSYGLALRITAEDLERDDLRNRVHAALLRLAIKPSECFLILDFGNLAISEVSTVAEIVVANFHKVMEIGLWGQVIWQATSFPEVNPSSPRACVTLPRTEWLAWRAAVGLDADFRKTVMFGDFGADSSKFKFGAHGGIPRRHYRYSSSDCWLVPRGKDEGSVTNEMQWVAKEITKSGHFAGRAFSSGDKFISETAQGAGGPGNATTWRKVNTVHHLTRVISDLGVFHGYSVAEREDALPSAQFDLPF